MTRKILLTTLICFLIIPALYTPVMAPRAQAILGAGDINIESIPQIVDYVFRKVGKIMAKKMVDDMVQSTIKWANSGFDGNPAYPGDWSKYLDKTTDDVASNFINQYKNQRLGTSGSGSSNSTVENKTYQAILRDYVEEKTGGQGTLNTSHRNNYNATTSYDEFMTGFKKGGWTLWSKTTQVDTENPFGSYIKLTNDLQKQIDQKTTAVNQEITVNKGYLSFRNCAKKNPALPPGLETAWRNREQWATDTVNEQYPEWISTKRAGECIEEGPVSTPGGVISEKLNQALGAGFEGLINADSIDALVSAFANGLLQRYVFSDKGLFTDSSTRARVDEVVDIDGDRIPDGYDYNQDGELDICHHGLKDPSRRPSNNNCIGSKGAVNSPYYSQICEASSNATRELEKYQKFVNANQNWDPNYYRTWLDKTTDAQQGVEDFISALSKYDEPRLTQAQNNFSLYSDFLGIMINSLLKDKDMRNDKGLGYSLMGLNGDNLTIQNVTKATRERVTYIKQFVSNLGQCENPNINAINRIGLPPDVDTTGSSTPSTSGQPTRELACYPSSNFARPEQPVTWTMETTYPQDTKFQWTGTDVSVAETDGPSNLLMKYVTEGTKSASITANFASSSPVTVSCDESVEVSSLNSTP